MSENTDADRWPQIGLTTGEVGAIGEDLLAHELILQSEGSIATGFPLVDQGYDLYARRQHTLRALPMQVKTAEYLMPDGQIQLAINDLPADEQAVLAIVHLPMPRRQLYPWLWVMTFGEFNAVIKASGTNGLFNGLPDPRSHDPWRPYLVETKSLYKAMLRCIPAWRDPVLAPPAPRLRRQPRQVTPWQRLSFNKQAELWVASQLLSRGLNDVVIAQDRLRTDAMGLLIHHLGSNRLAGLLVRAATLTERHVQFAIGYQSFFLDDRFFVIVTPWLETERRFADKCFLIPSAAIPEIATRQTDPQGRPWYHALRIYEPLSKVLEPFQVPTANAGEEILDRIFAKALPKAA